MRLNKRFTAPLLAVGLTVTIRCAAQISEPGAGVKIDYASDVRTIFMEKCNVCHGPLQQMGGLRLDTKEGRTAVAAGGAKSEFVRRISSQDPAVRMPPWPTTLGLSAREVETLKAWARTDAQGEDPVPPAATTAAILAAIGRGNVAQVRSMLKDRSLINVRDSDGASPLMYAALNRGTDCMKLLLQFGADPNVRNNEGATALIWAADDLAKVKLLLAAGADVHAKTRHGSTALLAASLKHGSSGVVAQLLEHGAKVNVADPDGWTPLIRAAAAGDLESMRLLLAHGADPNAPDVALSPLTSAIWFGNLDGVRVLLAKGARPDGKDAFGFTPLLVAALWDHKEIAELLLDKGADVNLASEKNTFMRRSPGTPLMLAAYAEAMSPAMVNTLIVRGAKVNFATPAGETAASRAREKGQSAVLAALLGAGAKEPVTPVMAKQHHLDPVPDLHTAVERSLAVLQPSDASFFMQTGCKSCHNQSFPEMALKLASERGFRFDVKAARRQWDTIAEVLKSQREKMLQWMDDDGPPLSGSWALIGLAAAGYPADNTTAAFVKNLAARQLPAGNWHPTGARPPIEYSDISATAITIRAMRLYGAGPRATEYEGRIDRARRWLLGLQPRYNDESVFQLLGLYWAKSSAAVLKKSAATLLAQQRSDGGWAQLSTLPSDAYATGQVLYALNQAGGLSTSDPAYLRGVKYLRETQMPDGSWLVESHAIAIQPALDAKFPHGGNQFISAAGTSWAAMALMLSVPPQGR